MSYNGWSNYETWSVSSWLDNDEQSQRFLYNLSNDLRLDMYGKIQILQGYVDNGLSLSADIESTPGIIRDLVTYALSNVHWEEIVEAHIEKRVS